MYASTRWIVACRAALILSIIGISEADAAGGKPAKPKPHPATAKPHVAKPRSVHPATSMNRVRTQARAQARQRQSHQRAYNNQLRYRSHAYRPGARGYRSTSNLHRYSAAYRVNRAIVQRLRSTHRMLARLDHDYGGHRIRAMHAINTAIRSLSHSSIQTYAGRRATGIGSNNRPGNRRGQPMPQATSDAMVRRASRSLQSVGVQLTRTGSMPNQARSLGSVRRAIRELNIALTIR